MIEKNQCKFICCRGVEGTLTETIIFLLIKYLNSLHRFLNFHYHMGKIKVRFVLIKLEDDEGLTVKQFDIKVIKVLELSREKEMEKL